MDMTKEKLIFKGVSEIVGTDDLALLTLTDEAKKRQISIVCDRATALQVELRLKDLPVTKNMLPEVLCRMTNLKTDFDFEIIIDDLTGGQYRTILYNKNTLETTIIRASDAVLLSIIADIPIFIETDLLNRQSVPYNADARGVTLPVNTISDDMLQTALDRAIADENYELASHLRDEKRRRKNEKIGD